MQDAPRPEDANGPSRVFWLGVIEAHILRHGLIVMQPYLARARALVEGKNCYFAGARRR